MMFVNKTPSIIILILLKLCLILLANLISTSESYIFIIAQLIVYKFKKVHDNNILLYGHYCNSHALTSLHIIGQCMVLHRHRESVDCLTRMRPSITSWIVLGSPKTILSLRALLGCYS